MIDPATDAGSGDLSGVSLAELERLARALRHGDLRCPISAARLAAAGLAALDGRLGALSALDGTGCLAVVHAVLAERRGLAPASPALIWTGPQAGAATGRDTAIAVRELFERAAGTVLVCGYRFDHGADIFEPLHAAMRDRGVSADVFLDVPPVLSPHLAMKGHLADFAARFLADNWPFGRPHPRLFYDPRTVTYQSRVSLHAKAAIVDEEWVLITSANFTDRGQSRNLELGVVLRDRFFATAVTEKLRRLQVLGLVCEMTA